MARIIKPPCKRTISVYLAGSIDFENWQEQMEEKLANENVVILNPRRDAWDIDWEQSIDNPKFMEQVEWELDALESCDIIAMYFDPKTKSPISLLEFGMFARSRKLIVCCPEGFWKKGNLEIVAKRFFIPFYDNTSLFLEAIVGEIRELTR